MFMTVESERDRKRKVRFYVDGIEYEEVTEVDDIAGYLIHYKKDHQGNFYFNEYHELERETIYGTVRIEILEGEENV